MTELELNETTDRIVKIRKLDRNEVPHVLSPDATPETVATAVMVTCLGTKRPIEGRQLKLRYIISLLKDYDADWQRMVNICNTKEKAGTATAKRTPVTSPQE